jgi:hypothetical protein
MGGAFNTGVDDKSVLGPQVGLHGLFHWQPAYRQDYLDGTGFLPRE